MRSRASRCRLEPAIVIRKLLFKLHLRNSYPSYLTGLDGSKVPCNIIRTDNMSADIRPIIGDTHSRVGDGVHTVNVYTSPPRR